LVQHIQKPEAAQEVKIACARLGQTANLTDRVWAECSADALSAALCGIGLDRDDLPGVAESLAAVIERLPRAQAAEHAARVTQVFLKRLEEPAGKYLGYDKYGPVIETMSPHLDAAAANHTAETLNKILPDFKPSSGPWVFLAKAQVAVCRRLTPFDAAAHANRMVDFVFESHRVTDDSDKLRYVHHADMLAALSEHLDAKVAARMAELIIAILGDYRMTGPIRSEFVDHPFITAALARVAECLDASGSLRAAESLIPVLKKVENSNNLGSLTKALVGVCRRLDADGSKRMAEAIGVAAQDPKTPVMARILLANGFVVVAGKLEPDKAATFDKNIVELFVMDLANAKPIILRMQLADALATVGGRGATSANRAAEALTAAICDPQAQLSFFKPFAAALASVSGQLPPEQATSHASKVAEVLDGLWIAKTNHHERAFLAQTMAEVWTHLSPHERAAHAKRMAADLGDALQDNKADTLELKSLADALVAVCVSLDTNEEKVHINAAADILEARLRKSKNVDAALLTETLVTLWLRLDQTGRARAADALCTVLSDPDGAQRYRPDLRVSVFKNVAPRLDERELERMLDQPLAASKVERVVLDVLGESKNRYCRNTWDYLDWKKSKGN